ncbi:MAG TPA: IgGFc-binding protein [Minicystis sp.]|nr:IgGFc-binding protein [Minicystis sp.]
MKLGLALFALVTCVAAAASTGGCGAGSNNSSGSFGGGGAGATGSGTGAHHAGAGGSGGTAFATTGTGSTCQTHCSSDLHDIVDCHGKVVKTCPMGQGCGAMGCVEACESAKENKSSIGCDYYAVDPDVIVDGAGACFAAFIANTWDSPVSITVDRGGETLSLAGAAVIPNGSGVNVTYSPLPNGMLPPGQVAIVFLSQGSPPLQGMYCPPGVTPAFAGDGAVHGTGYGQAFHIVTSAPVVAYDIFPYGGGSAAATSATLLLPTSAWDTNYVAVDAFRKSTAVPQAQPSIDIVGQENGTMVTISPTAAIAGGSGVMPTGMGQPITYNLDAGQIIQFTQDAELIGSAIQSDKPIAVWGAATCLSVDVGDVACDSAHQQIPPVKALGHEYVGVRYRNRFDGQEETPPWRMVGAVDGTNLTWDPAPPAGAPMTLNNGQVAEFDAAGPFTVASQDSDHPFYVSAHMTGCGHVSADTGNDCRGDPEFVNVVPPEQYLSSYVFFTDPTYPETNLVIVRKKENGAFADVTLDCAGTLTGWQPVGANGDYEYTRVDLVTGNFMGVNGCDNGRHEIHSTAPFGLTVWGWGSGATGGNFFGGPPYSQAVSYAYPAGASVQPINQVVVPPNPK